ncbi:hypothetical protein [Candidatus Merdisoma sp. JLR.KK006]|jgi:hypothetical protein|uniref:hypothetical protein n=1 Tax=Candidatus Merdisoma sp. JLR.KK006 TaxID=3112626 RepID=UPI002FF0C3E7
MEMMKMGGNFKKLITFALSAVMAIGLSVTTYASEPESMQIAGDDKIQVVLPTDAIGIFDFILDPQELINKTNASAYDGQIFEEGATLFFKRSDSEALVDYSSTSDAVTITNNGSVPIDVVITAGITVLAKDGFAMTDDREFTDDTRASLYLALIDGETEVPIMGAKEEAASLTITIPPSSEEEDNEYSFRLTGAANKEGDWSRMKDISFEVAVTWIVVPQEEIIPEEEMIPESGEMGLPDMQGAENIPVEDPGEKIVRKILPVVTDSNAAPDKEESNSLPMDITSDSPTEKNESAVEEKQPVGGEAKAEDASTIENSSEDIAP